MSYQIKNVSLKDGFAKNPDRYYCEEFFNQLPLSSGEFQAKSGSSGIFNFTIVQPANTFIKSLNVVCHTAVTIPTGDFGVVVGTSSSGTEIVSSETDLINNGTSLAANVVKILSLLGGVPSFTTTSRILYCGAKSTTVATATGKLFLIADFGSLASSSKYRGSDFFTITGINSKIPSFDGTNGYSGVKLTTNAAVNDQSILFSNLSSDTAISNGLFKPGSKLEFETSVVFPSIPDPVDYSFVAGLKLTSTPLVATDATQAMFIFGNSTPLVGGSTLASTTNLMFAYSIGGTDYITNLGLPIVADRVYHLKIKMNKQKKLCVYVNGIQFGLTSTSGSMGTLATNSYDESLAITDSTGLYPIVGIQIASTNARSVVVNYIKLSRETQKV